MSKYFTTLLGRHAMELPTEENAISDCAVGEIVSVECNRETDFVTILDALEGQLYRYDIDRVRIIPADKVSHVLEERIASALHGEDGCS